MPGQPVVAYFSMEIALDPAMPTYAGGLGVLAGDTIRAAADLGVPMVAVTLLHRKGYFRQSLADDGTQSESPVDWTVTQFLHEMSQVAHVTIEGRQVQVRAWKLLVTGVDGERGAATVPIFFLDADLPVNSDYDRMLTNCLYGGDARYRLCQEVALGVGGVRMLHAAHQHAKSGLIREVQEHCALELSQDVVTLGFARRFTAYKRPALLFHDVQRLKQIAASAGPIQVVFAGKAHPQDQAGKDLICQIFRAAETVRPEVKLAFLEIYDCGLAKLITAGVDVWLNTPEPPNEASGTSGMKAALNGVPSLSVLDGWWLEGCIEGVTGWRIGGDGSSTGPGDRTRDAAALYGKLERAVLPTFYRDRERFIEMMLHSIALNGSFFNTHRMLQQYVLKAYFG